MIGAVFLCPQAAKKEIFYSFNAPVQRWAAQRTVRCNRLFGGPARLPW